MIRTWKVYVEEKLIEEKLKAVIDNKHVLLPWLVMHAGEIITRYTTVHDGKTAYQRIKNKRPKGNHRRNKLIPIHQFGLFAGIAPRTGELMVLTLEGAVAARTVHRLSEDRRWAQSL